MRSTSAAFGVFFSFTAFMILLLCTLSAPIAQSIYFLKADVNTEVIVVNVTGTARFGVFGWCTEDIEAVQPDLDVSVTAISAQCSATKLSYTFNPMVLDIEISPGDDFDDLFEHLTTALVLVPISCSLSLVTLLIGMFTLTFVSRFWDITMFAWSVFATFITWATWIFGIVAFAVLKHHLRTETDDELRASFGNALWMFLGAAFALLFTTCLACYDMYQTFRRRRRQRHAAAHAAPPSTHPKRGWRDRFFHGPITS